MSLIISILSLIISGWTWFTKIRRGKIKMTRPSIICYLGKNGEDEPKVFVRTLLYSTSERGEYIQNMFISLSREDKVQNFNIWAYDDKGLVRGSGLYVNKDGFSSYHHFLLPKNSSWQFIEGNYKLEVFAETVDGKTNKIFEQKINLTNEQSDYLKQNKALYYDWAPDLEGYISNVK